MRSGTNQLHGGVFEFVRNDILDANNFFSNKARLAKAAFRQNQYGGTVGGPIIRNRTFYFFSYEGTRQRTAAASSISNVPPDSFRKGDFSAYNAPIYDPKARVVGPAGTVVSTPYANKTIPQSQLSSTAVGVMSEVPLPNYGAPNAQSQNYIVQIPRGFNQYKWDVKGDHHLSDKNFVFGRLSWSNQDIPSPGRFGLENPLGAGNVALRYSRQLVINDTHIFSPTMVNEFRFGYTHRRRRTGAKARPGSL
jgi:hypothetical protein